VDDVCVRSLHLAATASCKSEFLADMACTRARINETICSSESFLIETQSMVYVQAITMGVGQSRSHLVWCDHFSDRVDRPVRSMVSPDCCRSSREGAMRSLGACSEYGVARRARARPMCLIVGGATTRHGASRRRAGGTKTAINLRRARGASEAARSDQSALSWNLSEKKVFRPIQGAFSCSAVSIRRVTRYSAARG
jgi:hypothetical protein